MAAHESRGAGDGGHRDERGVARMQEEQMVWWTRDWIDQGALEANIKQAIEPNTPVMTFMVTHAATIINRFSVDQDSKTPMEKARGTAANRDKAEFGEKVTNSM